MERPIREYITFPVLLIILLLVLSLGIMVPVLDMVILGAILAFLIKPLVSKIQNKVKFFPLSIVLAIIVVVVPLILIIAYMLYVIVGVAFDFLSANPGVSFTNLNQTSALIASYLPIGDSGSAVNYVNDFLGEIGTYVVDYGIKIIKALPTVIIQIFVLVCSIYYFVRDGHKAYNFVEELVPDKHKRFFKNTTKEVGDVLNSIFYGHFITALIIGIFGAIGYSLLGYPYGVFLGILTGICQLIPIIGPWPIYWVLAIFDFISGNYLRLIIVLLFGFGLSTCDMYIRPALCSHYADIPPLILLIGFLAGPLVYGIVGFIVGPLILGITYAVLVSYKKEKLKQVE
ncbi:MAG: AI-2E family transporter [Methanobrevibacter sp.]|mgnify:CR=1 FL=1|nr:AI-2E family transporter [Methanobrevibacter sp.]